METRVHIFLYFPFYISLVVLEASSSSKDIKFIRESDLDGFNCPDEHAFDIGDNLSVSQCLARCAISPFCFGLFRQLESSRCIGCQKMFLTRDNAKTFSGTTFFRRRPVYKLVKERKTWTESQKHCAKLGGRLLDIKSKEENEIIHRFVASGLSVWLGASDHLQEGIFVWEDGSKMSELFENWYAIEPNDHLGNEDCANFDTTGLWNDFPCGNPHPSVCEFD